MKILNRSFILTLSFIFLGSVAFAGIPFSVQCERTGDLFVLRANQRLNLLADGTYEAEYLLHYKDQEPYSRKLQNLNCEFEDASVHCWNKAGQAYNFSEKRTTKIEFDPLAPQDFRRVRSVSYDSTFMFHPRPWAETGPDANKFQHMPFTKESCQLK